MEKLNSTQILASTLENTSTGGNIRRLELQSMFKRQKTTTILTNLCKLMQLLTQGDTVQRPFSHSQTEYSRTKG